VGRWEALRRLRIATDEVIDHLAARAREAPDEPDLAIIDEQVGVLERAFLSSGILPQVAFEALLGRASFGELRDILGKGLADMLRQEAHAGPDARERPPIPLPECFPDPDEAHVDAGPSAIPLPERFPDPGPATVGGADDAVVPEEDVRAVRNAEAHLGTPLTERQRRIAARMVNQLRVHALRDRGARLQPSPKGTLRRPRGSRAPRRAAHRTSVAPARDGPPPGEAPGPVAGARAPRCAIGGVR
jgi:hypothetical protein